MHVGRAQGALVDQPDKWKADAAARGAEQAVQVCDHCRDAIEDRRASQRRRLLLLREHGRRRRLHGFPTAVAAERKRTENTTIAHHCLRHAVLTQMDETASGGSRDRYRNKEFEVQEK